MCPTTLKAPSAASHWNGIARSSMIGCCHRASRSSPLTWMTCAPCGPGCRDIPTAKSILRMRLSYGLAIGGRPILSRPLISTTFNPTVCRTRSRFGCSLPCRRFAAWPDGLTGSASPASLQFARLPLKLHGCPSCDDVGRLKLR